MRTPMVLALAALMLSGCTDRSSELDDIQLEDDTQKTDSVDRPFGTFERELVGDEAGFTLIVLNEDRTYRYSQELVTCSPGSCTDERAGRYRFASSHGKRYVVLYDGDDWWYSLEYAWAADDADVLRLRFVDTSSWFEMTASQ